MVFAYSIFPAKKRAWRLARLAVMLGLAIPASAAPPPLTLEQAQRIAIERSGQISANDAAVRATREMAVAAAQNPDPVLKLGLDNLPVDGPDRYNISRDFMTQRRIGVMQEFTRAEKRQLRSERYAREADKALAKKSAIAADIQRDVGLAWLDRYYAEAMLSQMTEALQQAQLEIDAADSAYRSGRGSLADGFAARAARVALEDRASELKRRVRVAKVALRRWVGDADERPLAAKPPTDTTPFSAQSLEHQLLNHPTIDLLGKDEALAMTEAKLAQANKQSDWSVEMAYSLRGPQYPNMLSIGVSIPLQWDQKNRQDREVGAKLAQLEQVQAERQDALRAHVSETGVMLAEWDSARERQARIQHQLLPLAVERTQALLSAYRGGKSALNEVLGARRNEIEVRLQSLQLELEASRLWAQLNFMIPANQQSTPSTPSASVGSPGALNTLPNKEIQ